MKTLLVLLVIALAVSAGTCGVYNSAVQADQTVQNAVGDLDAAYQRRTDLIPNLVKTVQAAGQFEKSTFTELAEARSKAGQIRLTAADLNDPAKMKMFEKAQTELSSSLSRLLAVAESYPVLHATEGFRDLMTQLEGTENRIQTERHKVNDSVREYNTIVLGFPGGFIVRSFGFQKRASFQAAASSQVAPTIDFGGVK